VRHVTLEVPLRFLEVCGLFQRDHPCSAGVEVFHEPLNGAALAGRVATFEDDHVPSAGALAPVLQLQQFDLQPPLHPLVFFARHPLVIGVSLAPRVDGVAFPVEQHRIVVVLVVDGVPVFGRRKVFQIDFDLGSSLVRNADAVFIDRRSKGQTPRIGSDGVDAEGAGTPDRDGGDRLTPRQ
jgi:hypothetical protein